MGNITLAVDDKILKAARGIAKANGTTLNAMVRQHLIKLLDQDRRQEGARLKLIELMENSTGRMPKDWKFDRQKLYESPTLSRHKRAHLRSDGKGS